MGNHSSFKSISAGIVATFVNELEYHPYDEVHHFKTVWHFERDQSMSLRLQRRLCFKNNLLRVPDERKVWQ